MATPTTLPVNQAATDLDSFLKQGEGILIPIVEGAIGGAVPELEAPVVSIITNAVVSGIMNEATKYVQLGGTFLVIDLQTGFETSNMAQARASYLRAVASGDKNAIAAARVVYDQAESALANDDGGATPQ